MKKNRKRTIISALGAATVGAGIGVAAIAQACGPSGNDNPEIIEYAKYSETHNLAFWSNQTNHADFVSLSGAISDIAGSIGNNFQYSMINFTKLCWSYTGKSHTCFCSTIRSGSNLWTRRRQRNNTTKFRSNYFLYGWIIGTYLLLRVHKWQCANVRNQCLYTHKC